MIALFDSSSRLIAVLHVLRRHKDPRHPPYTLSILNDFEDANMTFYSIFKVQFKYIGGPKESRTPDLHCAKVALYQLSYGPESFYLALINNSILDESELRCYED